jgi:hypothetical protein
VTVISCTIEEDVAFGSFLPFSIGGTQDCECIAQI